ncbi:MAG: hypothetical protein JNL43_04640 [Flavobacteriales bacterium]|nr:hypothetical protein [Flavobacteriales bacterium]
MVRTIIFLGLFLAFKAPAAAQSPGSQEDLYPERLHLDIEILRNAIHEAHPDPYRYHTKAELDKVIDAVRGSIQRPMGIVDFECALVPIFKAIGDSHCRATWPQDFADRLRKEGLLIPIQVRILPEGLFLEDELKGFRSIPIGSRILSINERPVEQILERLLATVVTDGANRTYAERVVEREFAQRYYTYVEHAETFRVRYITPGKVEGQQTLFALTSADIARTRKPTGASLLPWGARAEQESGAMWVTMRTLDPDSLLRADQRPDRFIDALLDDARKNEAKTLVFDLRGAGGPDLAMAEVVFSAFAKQPFQVLDDMVVRSIAQPEHRASHEVPVDFYVSSNNHLLPGVQGSYRLPHNDPRLAEYVPTDKAFQGKVYIVCDGMTRDAAAALVMMARRTKRARVVGEETGSNAHGFTGGAEWVVTAPNSGLKFHVPLLKYIPAGHGEGPMDRGEQPDHQAFEEPGAMAKGRDSIKDALLELIREMQ